jgi:hypothetical protein
MNDNLGTAAHAATLRPGSHQARPGAEPPHAPDERRRLHDRQRELVLASLFVRPPGASSTHRRWA